MLLEVDGLADGWENGVASEWEMEADSTQDLPFALRRLITPGTNRNFDISGFGSGNDMATSTDSVTTVTSEVERRNDSRVASNNTSFCVNDMSLSYFRTKLIRHFNIAFQREEVKWPRRLKRDTQKES